MTGTGNDVTGSLAARVTTGFQGFSFADANDLTVGTADGLGGITTNNGAINVVSGVVAGPGRLHQEGTRRTVRSSARRGGAAQPPTRKLYLGTK